MCFSASVSYAASAGLLAAASYLYIQSKPLKIASVVSITMPLAFAVQQAAEGVVWVGLNNGNQSLAHTGSLVYQFFVFFWLVYFPLLGLVNEPKANIIRRRIFYVAMALGFASACYKFIPWLINDSWMSPAITKQCISYQHRDLFNNISDFWQILIYFTLCTLCLFVSSHRVLHYLAIVSAISIMIVGMFFFYAFTSLWCFSAAVMSIMIIKIDAMLRQRRPNITINATSSKQPC